MAHSRVGGPGVQTNQSAQEAAAPRSSGCFIGCSPAQECVSEGYAANIQTSVYSVCVIWLFKCS